MKLYQSPASPFARKVIVVLHETDQLGAVELVSAAGTAVDTGTMPLAQNPLGKIPALERNDGPALYDSRVICRYLDERAGAALYPEGPAQYEALTLEATGDGIMDAAILMVYEARIRPEELRYAPWVEAQWAKVTRALDALDARWTGHLAGRFAIGQIAVACALGYLDFRHPGRDWRSSRPGLADWFTKVSERPSLKATVPVA